MSFIRNSKVMTKLLVAAAITCAIVVAVGVMGMSEVSTMKSIADEMYEHELLGVQAAQSVDISLLKYVAQVERAVAHPELASEVRRGAAKLKEEAQHALDQLAESDKGHTVTEAERTVRSELPLFFASADQVLHGLETKDQDLVNTSEAAMLEHEARLDAAVHTMVAARVERAHAEDLQAARVFEESKTYMLGFIGIALLLGLGLAFGIARSISRPLGETVAVLDRIAEGDLTVSLADDRKDEVGQMARALNAAVQSMRTAMAEVRASATSVASTANQLTAAAEDISSGAQEQASGLEEAAASLEEMAEAIRQNAAGAERASDVSAESKTVATRGGEVVSQAVEAMEGVDAASHQISQIIGTIDEIAFQTNLLALNAAVEAARAGDQGRGFAVVASEVRNLAQRSASSAKEIKSLIEDSVRRVEAGSRLVSESGKSLTEIVGSVGRVSDLVQEIASASKEQSIGVGHVNAAVTQADRVTQSNAAQTEELSGSAETLAANSQQLLALANRFQLGDEEETAAAAPMLRLTRHADVQRPTAPHGTTSMPLAPTGTDGFEEF